MFMAKNIRRYKISNRNRIRKRINFTNPKPKSKVQVMAFCFPCLNASEDGASNSTGIPDSSKKERQNKVKLSDAEWKERLTKEQYHVCRNHGTERAWTGKLNESQGKGIYKCACCGADLFNSSTKFDSGSGWPSFFDTLSDKDDKELPAVDFTTDRSVGMVRTEVTCGKCDSHLGHVFNDGPRPTRLRYCINSASLKFEKDPKSEL